MRFLLLLIPALCLALLGQERGDWVLCQAACGSLAVEVAHVHDKVDDDVVCDDCGQEHSRVCHDVSLAVDPHVAGAPSHFSFLGAPVVLALPPEPFVFSLKSQRSLEVKQSRAPPDVPRSWQMLACLRTVKLLV